MNNKTLSSICVLRLTALGDCINAFGLINAIKENYPDIQLDWVIDSRFASLFVDENNKPLVSMHKVEVKNQGLLKASFNLYKELKNKKFDALFNLQTSIKASVLSLCIKAKLKFGYDAERRREGQLLFINRQAPSPDNPHVLAGFMAFAHSAGLKDLTPSWDYKLSDNEIKNAKALIQNNQRILTISPASAKAAKNWTVEGYIQVAKHAISKGFKIVLVGNGKTDTLMCNQISQALNDKCINLCSKTTLRELAAVISLSSVVISPDSAAMHLASSLDIPVISLQAIHNPDRVGAWNFRDLEVSVYQKMAMAELQGKKPGWRYRVKNEDAMKEIKTSMVIDTFDKAVSEYKL